MKIQRMLVVGLWWLTSAIFAQDLPLPQGAIKEQLPNGLTYIVLPNDQPKNKLEIRLVLRVGSYQEAAGEEGVAHFIEHLAFNGSAHYPEREAVSYWEGLGAKYGETINAFTTDDRTVYSLSLPTLADADLSKTLHILADWIGTLSFSPAAVEKERAIILEEIASYREDKDRLPIKVGNDPALVRLPIGTPSQVKGITLEKLHAFYHQWYAPQNTCVMLIGDINTQEAEKAIKSTFGVLSQRGKVTMPPVPIIYRNKPLIATKIEAGKNEVTLYFPKTMHSLSTHAGLLQQTQEETLLRMARARLREALSQAHIDAYWYLRGTDFLSLELRAPIGQKLSTEVQKAVGILSGMQASLTQKEVAIAVARSVKELQEARFEKTSEEYALSFTDAFLFGEAFLSTPADRDTLIKALETTTLQQWKALAKTYFHLPAPLVVETIDNTTHKTTYKHYKQAVRKGQRHGINVLPKEETPTMDTLAIAPPAVLTAPINYNPEVIASEQYFKRLGVHRIVLKNGATIYLKPTTDPTLNISLLFKGGYASLPQHNSKQYEDILSYLHLGGIEALKNPDYETFLYQNDLTFIAGMDNYHHLAMATAPVAKSAMLCHLLKEKLLHPELAKDEFQTLIKEEQQQLSSESSKTQTDNSLDVQLHKAIGTIYPPTREPKTLSDLQTIDLNALHSYYQEYLLSSEGLLCVITGDFDIETVKKQICPVIAMLKPQQASHREAPSTAVRKPVLLTAPSKESPQRASFNIVYPFTYEPHLGSVLSLKLLAEVIRDRVVSEVRERKGLIYSPYTTIELRPSPAHQAYIIVSGMADTKNVNEIKTTVDNIVQTLKNKPLTAEQLAPYKKRFMINKNESLTPDNSYAWRTYLTDRFKDGIPLEELEQYEEILLDNDCQHKEQH